MVERTGKWIKYIGLPSAIIAIATVAVPVSKSDAPPLASIARAESIRMGSKGEWIGVNFHLTWQDYCQADKANNQMALRATIAEIETLQREYMEATGGVLTVNPCP